MKVAMIHVGQGVDEKEKAAIVFEIKRYREKETIRIRTLKIDTVEDYLADVPKTSEKIHLIFFFNVPLEQIRETKLLMSKSGYDPYYVRIGTSIQDADVHESIDKIIHWKAKNFLASLKFIHP